MKKILCAALSLGLLVMAAAGCGQKVSGSVSTDGSTSMEEVIGALGEAFSADNPGVNFTYNPTGSGSGIQAVAGEMAYSSGLQRQALFSIALVLFLFILLINAALNFFLKGRREDGTC